MQDTPVESAAAFHERTQRYMREFICIDQGPTKGIFGRVQEWVVRYEVQDRG
jgi:hypothetical protein